jgi:hypothetical protein
MPFYYGKLDNGDNIMFVFPLKEPNGKVGDRFEIYTSRGTDDGALLFGRLENKETGNTYTGANDGKNGDCASSKKETPVLTPINEHYTDVTTVTLGGVEWFKSAGCNKNRPEERKLKSGDAIVYKEGDCKTLGFMIIRSFDYPADHAARAIYGRNPYKHSDGTETCTYYSDYSPSFSLYRFATEDEIRDFFNEFGKERVTNKLYLYYLDKIKETVPDKYDKYFVV